MTRLDEGRLRAYLDGEIPDRERDDVEAWIREDAAARDTLEEMEDRDRRVSALLSTLDGAAPTERVRQNLRTRLDGGVPGGGPAFRSGGGWWRLSWAQAAGLVMLLAGGVAAAVPGSPVREWIGSLGDTAPTATAVPDLPDARAGEPAVAGEDAADPGFMISPANGSLRIELIDVAPGTEIVTSVVSEAQGAFFASQTTRVEIQESTGTLRAFHRGGNVRVAIPEAADRVVMTVNGRMVLSKDGASVEILAEGAERSDREIVFTVQN